jgi:hypothetical protein
MTIKFAFFFIISLFLAACNKPEPNPELKDPIYQDFQTELSIVDKNLEGAKKQLAEHEATLAAVVPQTGQIKFAQKRVFDAQNVISTFEQQKKYWMIRAEQRRNYVRKKSMQAFQKGEKWEDPTELEEYMTEKRLRAAKLHWDSKQRRTDFMKESGLSGAKGPKAAAEGGH